MSFGHQTFWNGFIILQNFSVLEFKSIVGSPIHTVIE